MSTVNDGPGRASLLRDFVTSRRCKIATFNALESMKGFYSELDERAADAEAAFASFLKSHGTICTGRECYSHEYDELGLDRVKIVSRPRHPE